MTSAKSSSGAIPSQDTCPFVPPPWPIRRTPSTDMSIHASPTASHASADLHLRAKHLLHGLGPQQLAAFDPEARVAEEVTCRRDQATGGIGGAPHGPRARHDRLLVLIQLVTDDESSRDRVVREVESLLEAERLEDEPLHHVLEPIGGDDFDHSSGDVETSVVVCPDLAERRQLRELLEPSDHARERVVAEPEVVEVVALPAAGVGEKVADGDSRCDIVVG